ncbi:Superoxide dismutase [Cu-Zn] precursor [Corynebacterium occultum]|uniref:Superoxide dismutase [Cu-Zn] n=1 Tax=Corynebacterium occultum TaxID=2675219 RepID=A0A6B8W9B6_9CORY|nr:superoxide dismutase family protein [Corynebacterium occultum]QGU06600.1 Superoxide dismutase [Cu-Zn] precursor [Corynebacterium occultum]
MHIKPRSTTSLMTRAAIAALSAASLITLSACATEDQNADQTEQDTVTLNTATEPDTTPGAMDGDAELSASVINAEDANLGSVNFNEEDGAVQIDLELSGLEPGFYGLHIHQIGECETDSAAPDDPENTGDFLSAGSHIGAGDAEHPDHPGDLPQLLVKESGEAVMSFETDRLTLADLSDEDGAALMIHSDPDNYANIPERYAAEGADDDSRSTGDAGSRLACGVIATS